LPSYQTPGVYYERVDVSGPAIGAIRTDIAGFIGISTRGQVDRPVPVQSWRQFQAYFGDFSGTGYLAYAVRAFFENGGRRCWVVRVGSQTTQMAEMIVNDVSGKDAWRITANSPGTWGNELVVRLVETHQAQTTTIPGACTPDHAAVRSTAGFERAVLTRLSQGGTQAYRVVSGVDASKQRLLWVNPDPRMRLAYDTPLSGFDWGQPIRVESLEYTLLVWEAGRLLRAYSGLSLVPEHPRYGPQVLAPLVLDLHYGPQPAIPATPEPVIIEELRALEGVPTAGFSALNVSPEAILPLRGGFDGLAQLTPYDFIGAEVDALDSDEVRRRKQRGLRLLEEVGEVSILAVPDIHIQPLEVAPTQPAEPCIPDPCLPAPPLDPAMPRGTQVPELPPVFDEGAIYQVQAAMVAQSEKLRDRVALLDSPFRAARDDVLGTSAARTWRSRFDSKYAAFYYPWVLVVDPLRRPGELTRTIPPSGHVAGQYAQTDLQLGVHKAPANSPLVWVQDVSVAVNESVHGLLNELGINVIRSFPARGLRIFGARTVSSDPDWRYVNVRRLMMMIEKAIDLSTQWAVFEPNDTITRAKLHLSLTSFLSALWQQGALMGDSPDAAFFVRCDEDNNPPDERASGRLLAEVGVAPSKPFEFVVLRVGRTINEFEIAEERAAAGGM
jgi:uncharacterized protein